MNEQRWIDRPLSPQQLFDLLLQKNIQKQICQEQNEDGQNIKKFRSNIKEYESKIMTINQNNKSILTIIDKRYKKIIQLQELSNKRKKAQLKIEIQRNRYRSLASQAEIAKRNSLRQTYRFHLHNNQQLKFKIQQVKQYISKMECQNTKLIEQKNILKLIQIRKQPSNQNFTKMWTDKVEAIKKQYLTEQMEFHRLKLMKDTKQLMRKTIPESDSKLKKCGSLTNLVDSTSWNKLLTSRTTMQQRQNNKEYKMSLSRVKSLTKSNFYPSYQSIYQR